MIVPAYHGWEISSPGSCRFSMAMEAWNWFARYDAFSAIPRVVDFDFDSGRSSVFKTPCVFGTLLFED
jgi:hypothetical protein